MLSRLLLIDGIILIILAFVHLIQTPIIHRWLDGQLSDEMFSTVSPVFLFNHIVIGILLLPIGVSTLYVAEGVRVGQRWARTIAMINAVIIMVLPPLALYIGGVVMFNSMPFAVLGAGITFIGLTMLIPLIWMRKIPAVTTRSA